MVTGHDRYPRRLHQLLGRALGPHGGDRGGGRTDKCDARRLTQARKSGILRQETIAWMNGLRPGTPCNLQNDIAAKIEDKALPRGREVNTKIPRAFVS